MKNFTITFTGIERNFDVSQSAVTRNFEIRQGVGSPGPAGAAATVSVGTTTTGAAGTNASVTNSGTSSAAVFNFTIPRGDTGATGAAGPNSVTSATSSDGTAGLDVAFINIKEGAVTKAALSSGGLSITDVSNDDYFFAGIDVASLTEDRTIFIPNASGTIALTVSTAINEKIEMQGGGESGFVAPNFYAYAALSASLREGNTGLACLTWGDSGEQNLTIPSGTAFALNNTSFTYGSGAASAHRTALEIGAQEVKSANFTAADKGAYVATATLTVTDPTPSEGASFSVLVRNGTATVGGTAYAVAGTLIRRVFHSGAWANYPYSSALFGANVATFLATPTSANLAAAVTDETGSGSLVFATSPTLTTPTIAQINGGTAANDDLILQGTTNATRTTSYINLQPNGGFVGVNTSTPSHALQVFGTANRVAVFGDVGASTSTATPVNVSFGSTFGSNTPGTVGNLKWDLFTSSSSGSRYGIGMSAGLMEFQAGPSGGHAFYVNQGTEAVRIDSTGGVGLGTTTPSAKAILDLTSTTRGFLPPRMTTAQRDAITSVPAGLMIYNTTTNKLNFYNGSAWEAVTSA